MVKLRETPRTATFAWSPVFSDPLLVTGTVAGAIDADFSSSTHLEVWDLNLQLDINTAFELKPKVVIDTEARFHDIAWGGTTSSKPLGVIAGALEDGALEIWDPKELLDGQLASCGREVKHTGPIKALQFNCLQSQLLATAGSKGEIFVWDLNKLNTPATPGPQRSARQDDIDTVAWNNKVAHILATAGNTGFTSVWDLKNKREVLHLCYSEGATTSSRNAVSSVVWHPNNSTKLMTASEDDTNPVICLWDLRNANAPEKILRGHEKGVISLDWCKMDDSLLLTSGKDHRTLLWNPLSGEQLVEYPTTTNWTFKTKFNPCYSEIFASASFDGKISIQTLQDVGPKVPAHAAENDPSAEDFWNTTAQIDNAHPKFLKFQAPAWLKRPVSAKFGFGGKIAVVRKNDHKVAVSQVLGDKSFADESLKLAKAMDSTNVEELIKQRIESAPEKEKYQWEALLVVYSGDKRKLYELFHLKTDADTQVEDESAAIDQSTEDEGRSPGDVSFFENFDNKDSQEHTKLRDTQSSSVSKEPFQLYTENSSDSDKSLISAILSGEYAKAIDSCIKEERFADAFMLAMNGKPSVKERVKSAFLAKHAEGNPVTRLLAAVTSNDISDLVDNADLAHWREILLAICTYASPEKSQKQFAKFCSMLGDRLLAESAKKESSEEFRQSAVLCYIAAYNLEKVSELWHSEILKDELELLNRGEKEITPYSAHVKALHLYMEKVTVFLKALPEGSTTKESCDGWNMLHEAFREYANIVSSQGELEVAQKYLAFLPTKDPSVSLEKDRLLKASRKSTSTESSGIDAQRRQTNAPYGPQSSSYASSARRPQANTGMRPTAHGKSAGHGPNMIAGHTPQLAAPSPSRAAIDGISPTNVMMTGPNMVSSTMNPVNSGSSTPRYSISGATYANPYQPANSTVRGTGTGVDTTQGVNSAPGHRGSVSIPGPPPLAGSSRTLDSQASSIINQPSSSSKKDGTGWNDLPLSALQNAMPRRPPVATSTAFGASSAPYQPMGISGAAPSSGVISPPVSGRQTPLAPPPPTSAKPPRPSRSDSTASNSSSVSISGRTAPVNPYAPPDINPTGFYGGGVGVPRTGATPVPTGRPPTASTPVPAVPGIPSNPYAVTPGPAQSPNFNSNNSARKHGNISSDYYGMGPSAQSTLPMSSTLGPPLVPRASNSSMQAAPPPPPDSLARQGNDPKGAQSQETSDALLAQRAALARKPKHPPGDRAHIPESARPIFEILTQELELVKPQVPADYTRQIKDAEKRLNILFDHLNNQELLTPETVLEVCELAQSIKDRNFLKAQELHLNIVTTRGHECTNWMVGIKRLLELSRALHEHA